MVLALQEKDKTMATNEIQIIRLTSGETIIGKVIKDTPNFLTVVKPALVFTQQGQNGQQQVGLAPLAPFCKTEEINLYKSSIQFNELGDPQIVSNYIKATTNLDIPATPGLITG